MNGSMVRRILAAAREHQQRSGHQADFVVLTETAHAAVMAELRDVLEQVSNAVGKEAKEITRLAGMRIMVAHGEHWTDQLFGVGSLVSLTGEHPGDKVTGEDA